MAVLLRPIEARWRRATVRDYRAVCAVLAFACLSAVVSDHILRNAVVPGQPHLPRWGLVDFRDTIYYPVRAFLDGNNPYDAPRYLSTYPAGMGFPPYSPMALLLYLPFGLLKFEEGAIIFLLLNIALIPGLAWLALRMCGLAATVGQTFVLATLILVSRGGYVNLFIAQCTIYMALATYAALHFGKKRPWLAGVALALTTLKPTIGAPLAVLMLVRREVRPAVIGLAAALVGAAVPAAILANHAGGVRPLLASLATTRAAFQANGSQIDIRPVRNRDSFATTHAAQASPGANAATAPMRVDSAALLGRLVNPSVVSGAEIAITLAILGLGAFALRRLAATEDDATRRLSASLVCLTMLTCIYQQVYSLVLLTLPLTALATGQWGRRGDALQAVRWPLLLLLGLPMTNYSNSRTALELVGIESLRLGNGWMLALARVNGVALLAAFLLCVALAWVGAPSSPDTVAEPSTDLSPAGWRSLRTP